ncbi:PR domain zinc finger protein 14 [Bienertia sinuspersici]
MGNTNPWKTQQSHQSFTRKFLPYVLYAILPLVLLHFYLYPTPPLLESPTKDHFSYLTPILIPSSSSGQKSGNEVLDSVSVTLKEKETGNENLLQETKEIGGENLLPESKEIEKENLLPELKENVYENSHSESTLPPEGTFLFF